ncbi:response regulator receiver protein [Minicystis rosea]|nr:response regulator receiver protein [Minicystis rosea]
MASTLLAVDDSVTMRKVLEITFAGPDFRVVTANSPDAALQKLKTDKFDLVIADLSLEPNGYDLCKAVKKASPTTPVLLLSSKQNAYDAAKGSAAQADEHMDKPFDTQQMIDKVKKLLAAGPTAAAPKPVEKSPVASAPTTPSMQAPVVAAATAALKPAAPAAAAPPAAPAAAAAPPVQRAKTLIYNPPAGAGIVPPNAQRAPAPPTPVSGLPLQSRTLALDPKEITPAPAIAAPPTVAAGIAPAAALVNGHLQAKLEQIGLTPAQVDAVAALSREVVERVVWEVVPVLAETMIKEELARLTK